MTTRSCWSALLLVGPLVLGRPLAADDAPPPPVAKTQVTHADAATAAKLVADKQVVVLDVRTPEEYTAGHIAGAVNVDYTAADFAARLGTLDKNTAYLVHCRSGGRSTKALVDLERLGFTRVVHLDGGITAWEAAGNAIEK